MAFLAPHLEVWTRQDGERVLLGNISGGYKRERDVQQYPAYCCAEKKVRGRLQVFSCRSCLLK